MLNTLILKNLVLIEQAQVDFKSGFTVITGETGAGKTVLIEALLLILGERADASKVRKGCEKAFIQASFSVTPSSSLLSLFEESGIPFSDGEDLILTREINSAGKNRAYVCGQMIPIAFLQKIAPFLIDFIGQHAQIALKNTEEQRRLLDLYSSVDLSFFQDCWKEEKRQQTALERLQAEKAQREQKKILVEQQIKELYAAGLKEEEKEENLFDEYTLLSNTGQLLNLSSESLERLDEARQQCQRAQNIFDEMEKHTLELKDASTMAKEGQVLLEEIQIALRSFQAKIESDPNRLQFLEERLKILDQLKRRYGTNPLQRLKELEEELITLDSLEDREEELKKGLTILQKKTTSEIEKIRKQRLNGAQKLQEKLSTILKELNIHAAKLRIRVLPTARTQSGEDEIAFFLRANKGEEEIPVKENLSGGELSRLLFAFKIIMAEKSQPPTMVFDEIDANVGGKTSAIIGQYLKKLGTLRQVLCITHFPQVARQGDHHICVSKRENKQRTEGQIQLLSKIEKEVELLRMLGGGAVAPHP